MKSQDLVEYGLPGLVIMQDRGIVYANQPYADILGYSIDELKRMSIQEIWSFIHPEDQSRLKQRFKDFHDGKHEFTRKMYRIFRRDGKIRWVESFVSVIQYNGKPAMQTVMMDITEQREAEQALMDSESRYCTVIETTPDAIVLTNLDGVIMMANNGASTLTGYDDILGRSIFDFLPFKEHEKAKSALKTTLERKGPDPIEFTILTIEGSRVPTDISASVVLDTYENPTAFVIVARDISERKRTELELKYAKDQALLYLDIMGHDIRNQLQAILGNTEVARGLTQKNNLKLILQNITEGATRCEQIISKIKATENLMSLQLRPRNLCEVLIESISGFQSEFPTVNIEVKCNFSEINVDADDYLEIMCSNLLENAIQHNPYDIKHVWIVVYDDNEGFEVRIADDGKGISDSIKSSLFDIHRRFGGVGLHQVGEIVHKYRGRIDVVDRIPGKSEMGTEFRIWLPKSKMSDD